MKRETPEKEGERGTGRPSSLPPPRHGVTLILVIQRREGKVFGSVLRPNIAAKEASSLTAEAMPLTRLVPCNQRRRGRLSWLRDTPCLERQRERGGGEVGRSLSLSFSLSLTSGAPVCSVACQSARVGKGEHTHASTMTYLCIYVHLPSFAGCLETRSWIMFAPRARDPSPLQPPRSDDVPTLCVTLFQRRRRRQRQRRL